MRISRELCSIKKKYQLILLKLIQKCQICLETQDVKKPHENPSVGIILCKSKDDDVVEYALNRNLSPALIAEYQTKLLDKKLMQQKLHHFFILLYVKVYKNATEYKE